MEVDNLVNNMTSADFSSDDVLDAVEVAYYYCSAIFGTDIALTSGTVGSSVIDVTDTQQGMSITLLAQAILIEGRKTILTRNNPNLVIRTTEELFTNEMRNMLLTGDETNVDEVSEGVMWSDDLPTENWEII